MRPNAPESQRFFDRYKHVMEKRYMALLEETETIHEEPRAADDVRNMEHVETAEPQPTEQKAVEPENILVVDESDNDCQDYSSSDYELSSQN